MVLLATVVNLATGIRYRAQGEVTLDFVPFPGLVLCLRGGLRIPFTHRTQIEYSGKPGQFIVKLEPSNASNQETEEAQIGVFMEAGFRVWWPYDRAEHLKRKPKPQIRIVR